MDLKFALRSLRNSPAFTILAVLVMALGIGANTAVFSVVNAVLLKPLDYPGADRIVTIRNNWRDRGAYGRYISAPDFHDWHDQSTAFEAMAYYSGSGADGSTAVIRGTDAEYTAVTSVTAEFFDVFGVRPLNNRGFSADEQKPKSGGAVLISNAYWHAHYNGNAGAIGQTLRIYDKPMVIVGVMPEGFQFPGQTDLWIPANSIFEENTDRSSHNYFVVARLKPGVSIDQAQAQLATIADKNEHLYPNSNTNKGVIVTGMLETMVSNVRFTLYMLLGAVGLVLLIACANMANLLLAKATARTREIAIRAAVGASRGRIIQQLVTESLLLAVMAGIAGLILAWWGSEWLVALAPSTVPRLAETTVDKWVLTFTLAISIVSSVLFGLAPAIQASRVDLNDSLKQGAGKGVVGGGAAYIRNGLVVAEIALSVVLLTGAGLLFRSFDALSSVDLGFRAEQVLVAKTDVAASDNAGLKRAVQFDTKVLADIRSLPGVISAGAQATTPGTVRSNGSYAIDTLPPPSERKITKEQAVFTVIAPGTFDTLGMRLKRGRDFSDGDTGEVAFSAIVNEALVKESFAGRDPMGHIIYASMDSPSPMKIVGVVGNVRQWGPQLPAWPEIFMPYPQHPGWATQLSLLIRTASPPSALKEAVRRKIGEESTDVPVKSFPLSETVQQGVAAPRFRTLLLMVFAGLAVCLAMAGVYGVMAYVVSQRANEIGVRIALGARSFDVLKMVLGQALILTALGLALGLAGAFAASKLIESMLFEVKPNDPLTYVAVSLLLAVVALAASLIPALRAARVDPLIALRQE